MEHLNFFMTAATIRSLNQIHFFDYQVQLRQKTDQKKTLYYVEQLLIKYNATKECSAIKPVGGKRISSIPITNIISQML